jgi:hypothetical protein
MKTPPIVSPQEWEAANRAVYPGAREPNDCRSVLSPNISAPPFPLVPAAQPPVVPHAVPPAVPLLFRAPLTTKVGRSIVAGSGRRTPARGMSSVRA